MEQIKCNICKIGAVSNEEEIIVFVDDSDIISITAEIEGKEISVLHEYYLPAYQIFRDKLLNLGYGLRCNGSRINAIQSGMMGFCDQIYIVEFGKQAIKENKACIWDYAIIDEFPNTESQLLFAEQWYDSLK